VQVIVTPVDDDVKELQEKVTLTIAPIAGLAIANPTATATIRSAELAGDYNEDGTVDGADFLAWQRGFGRTADPIGSDADGNLDGNIDGGDLTVWKTNFGRTTVVAIPPEPAIAALLAPEEDPSAGASLDITSARSWYGQTSSDEAPVILTSSAGPHFAITPRAHRRRDVREEVFAHARDWSHGGVGSGGILASPLASTSSHDGDDRWDREAIDELASQLALRWREF
jgi:hypothetical protein